MTEFKDKIILITGGSRGIGKSIAELLNNDGATVIVTYKNSIDEEYFKSKTIEARYNTPYCPEENGKIERFHKTLKNKALPYGFIPSMSLDSFQYKLTLFLHYYNYRKKHRGLGMEGCTPHERMCQLESATLRVYDP
mgnify:CR=1 FL=1